MLQDLRAGALDSKCSLGLLKLQRLVRIRSVVQLDRLMTARRPKWALDLVLGDDSHGVLSGRKQSHARKRSRPGNLPVRPVPRHDLRRPAPREPRAVQRV
ncbi:hypothetical protein THICB6_60371 [Thiomonas arsenitoxydans]|nr:hypothetical protein THICB6_60371 [Thiomonas arsenitoxydans]